MKIALEKSISPSRERAPAGSLCKRRPCPVDLQRRIEMLLPLPFGLLFTDPAAQRKRLHKTSTYSICASTIWGRTGFDSSLEARAACRGGFVGLVKNRTKTNKRRSRRSRSRGLIDCDVSGVTPASVGNVDSRLADRRSDRVGL